MLNQFLMMYLIGALGLLLIATRLQHEVPLAAILIAAFVWPIALPVVAWKALTR